MHLITPCYTLSYNYFKPGTNILDQTKLHQILWNSFAKRIEWVMLNLIFILTNFNNPLFIFVRNYHANRLLSAMCFSFYCFRFVQLFEINNQIGPKVFMLKKMSIDLFFFLFLLMVIVLLLAREAPFYSCYYFPCAKHN